MTSALVVAGYLVIGIIVAFIIKFLDHLFEWADLEEVVTVAIVPIWPAMVALLLLAGLAVLINRTAEAAANRYKEWEWEREQQRIKRIKEENHG